MPDTITVASVQQYSQNVELLLQQSDVRLASKAMQGSYVGKAASVVEQFGSATAQLKTGRHADTPLLDLAQDKRWVFPSDYEWASLIDNEDQLRAIVNLTSPYAMAGAAAMNRAMDDVFLAAIFGTNYTGENGTATESFGTVDSGAYDVSHNVGGADSSLNVLKLREAIRKLMVANKGDLGEPVYGAISGYEHDALLGQMEIANRDYGATAVLVDGKVKRFMGIDFTITERLAITSGNRLIPIWLKSGMHFGTWNGVTARIGERPDKSYATQVFTAMTIGATRTQLGKQIRVGCDDQI